MNFTPTAIPDVVVIDPAIFADERGFLMETFQAERFNAAGIDAEFVQDVHSRSSNGVLRGLHYQLGKPQGKLIRVIRGDVFDVAVDIRKSSPTFSQWVDVRLTESNRRLLWVPPGFAHGFLVLSEFAELEYRMTDFHAPDDAHTILWDDAEIGVAWPLTKDQKPLLSEKDLQGVPFRNAKYYA